MVNPVLIIEIKVSTLDRRRGAAMNFGYDSNRGEKYNRVERKASESG